MADGVVLSVLPEGKNCANKMREYLRLSWAIGAVMEN